MTLNELANLAVHATFSEHQDPVAAIEALEIRWRSARDPAGKATPLADALLRALRRTDPAALKLPPFLLLQAAAVVLTAAATPWNIDAAELAAADRSPPSSAGSPTARPPTTSAGSPPPKPSSAPRPSASSPASAPSPSAPSPASPSRAAAPTPPDPARAPAPRSRPRTAPTARRPP